MGSSDGTVYVYEVASGAFAGSLFFLPLFRFDGEDAG